MLDVLVVVELMGRDDVFPQDVRGSQMRRTQRSPSGDEFASSKCRTGVAMVPDLGSRRTLRVAETQVSPSCR
jgi:hypothetical protein